MVKQQHLLTSIISKLYTFNPVTSYILPFMSVPKKLLFVLLMCIFTQTQAKGIDTNFIVNYGDKLILKSFGSLAKTYMPYNLPKKLPQIDFTTNSFIYLGFGFSYKWLGFRYGFNIAQIGDTALYDKTVSTDLYLNVYLTKHLADIMYITHQGFYNANPIANKRNFNDKKVSLPKQSNLRTTMVGFNYLYVFNGTRFSFKSSFTQSEQQIKSSGSFLLGASFNYFAIDADSSLVPTDYINKDSLSINDEYLGGMFVGPSIRAGYGYNLILFKNLSLLAAATPGVSIEYNSYKTPQGKQIESFKPNLQTNFRVALTYSNPSFFAGVNVLNDFYFHNLIGSSFKYTTWRLECFMGCRLNHLPWENKKNKQKTF